MAPDIAKGTRLSAFMCLSLSVILAGCGPLADARRSMQDGNSLAAVSAYRQALARKPHDPMIRQELEVAQSDAASKLAAQARTRASLDDFEAATRLAEQAAQLDPQYRTLAADFRRALARRRLDEARDHLAAGHLPEARQAARAARQASGELTEVPALLAAIDAAEAAKLESEIALLLDAGEFEQAAELADRIARLQPGRQEVAQLPAKVDLRRREALFDRVVVAARSAIASGELARAADLIAELTAMAVREDDLLAIREAFNQRADELDAIVADARRHREAEHFESALALYDQALAIAVDRSDLADERDATARALNAQELRIAAANAIDMGDAQRAIELLKTSQDLVPDERTRHLRWKADIAWHERQLAEALDADDHARAVNHCIELLTLKPSEELAMAIDQLRERLVDETLRRALQLHAANATREARATLESAMGYVSSEAIDQMHADLRSEELVQQAVDQEQQGRYDRARSLYLAALAVGGDRAGIEGRIDDTDELAAMQAEMEAAIREAEDMFRQANALRHDLADRDRAIQELERIADALSYDVSCLKRDNAALSRKIYDLKCEIDRLCAQLRRVERDRDHWRRKYQQAASSLPRRPHPGKH